MDSFATVIHVRSAEMSERRKQIVDILRQDAGFVSGEAMSRKLGVSRNAIHKHVSRLRSRGYRIVGISRRGYKLQHEPDALSMTRVTEQMKGSLFGRAFRHHDELECPDAEAQALALGGAPEGTVVVAESLVSRRRQGRDRRVTPPGKGLLFSLVLRPCFSAHTAPLMTMACAVAVAETLESLTGVHLAVKWPAEILAGDKRIASMTSRLAMDAHEIDWLIIGAEISINTEFVDLPIYARRSTSSLAMETGRVFDRSDLLAALLKAIEEQYLRSSARGFAETLTAFRGRDYLSQKLVTLDTGGRRVSGTAVGIDDLGSLLIELPGRQVKSFHSGGVMLGLESLLKDPH